MKVYESAERTHTELSELRANEHRRQLAELRNEFEKSEKQQQRPVLPKKQTSRKRTSKIPTSSCPASKRLAVVEMPSPAEVGLEQQAAIDKHRRAKLLSQGVGHTSPYYRLPLAPEKPIFAFVSLKNRLQLAETNPESDEQASNEAIRVVNALPSSPSPPTERSGSHIDYEYGFPGPLGVEVNLQRDAWALSRTCISSNRRAAGACPCSAIQNNKNCRHFKHKALPFYTFGCPWASQERL